jgi:hypothetical protein
VRGHLRAPTRAALSLLAVVLLATSPANPEEPPADAAPERFSPRALRGARLADIAFLAGLWTGGEGSDASWQVLSCPAGDRMVGVQEDLREGRSRFFEFQLYAQRGDHVVFFASPLGRPPTPFVAVEVQKDRAVFENVHHDFPQRILMWLEEDELVGRIEGETGGETRQSEWRWRRSAAPDALLPHCRQP